MVREDVLICALRTRTAVGEEMPIITSLLDLDLYKLTMLQFIWIHYRSVETTFRFVNRTTRVRLADVVHTSRLRREFDSVEKLRFTSDEVSYLRSLRNGGQALCREDFLHYLEHEFRMAPIHVGATNGDLVIHTTGLWTASTLWETIVLAIVNELYGTAKARKLGLTVGEAHEEALKLLEPKIAMLRNHPEIKIMEFGTRRRFSRQNQKNVFLKLKETLWSQLLGPSNVLLAKETGTQPKGTMAHELFMGLYGLCRKLYGMDREKIIAGQKEIIAKWWDLYGAGLSIYLPDTYGTDAFYRLVFSAEDAKRWKGGRQDSGNIYEFTWKTLAFLEQSGVDPRTKVIAYSDGLTIPKCVEIAERVGETVGKVFGPGTNLTFDIPGIEPISIVMKLAAVFDQPTVKLSDNLDKATGPEAEVAVAREIFGYTNTYAEKPVY